MSSPTRARASQASTASDMRYHQDDSEYESDFPEDFEPDEDEGRQLTLNEIGNGKTIGLSIVSKYAKAWRPREAFRELIQNWRDAIIRSFGLREQDFRAIREEQESGRNVEIVYKVPQPNTDPPVWLGYIRFKGHDGAGTIEIVNRRATLEPWNLGQGGTSKEDDDEQAGAHGEGFKLALIVLMRLPQNHGVRCRSGGYNWAFNFDKNGWLVCRLNRMSPSALARADGDVQFIVGQCRRGRNRKGELTKRRPVMRADFEAWTSAALFLRREAPREGAMVTTPRGDLLLDPPLRGNVYLKGLLLSESSAGRSASLTNCPLKFGYNFHRGTTNRDRAFMSNTDQESKCIMAIWSRVLAAKPELAEELSDMLNSTEIHWADVSDARSNIKADIATRLKEYLLDERFSSRWYYAPDERKRNPRLFQVIRGLGREPFELTQVYWNILVAKLRLLRTAEEEERRRFTKMEPVPAPQTTFAASVERLLRGCMRACPQTRQLEVVFVRAGSLSLQLFFSAAEKLVRIHELWLARVKVEAELPLAADAKDDDDDDDDAAAQGGGTTEVAEADVVFHIVKRLFSEVLWQLRDSDFESKDAGGTSSVGGGGSPARSADWHRRLQLARAEQRLLNHARVVDLQAVAGPGAPSLYLTWQLDSGLSQNTVVEVQCHSMDTCSRLRDTLILAKDALALPCWTAQQDAADGLPAHDRHGLACRSARMPIDTGEYYVEGLGETAEYFFVLVVPSDPSSFVVISAPERTERNSPLPSRSAQKQPERPPHRQEQQKHRERNLQAYVVTDSDDDDVGAPRRSAPGQDYQLLPDEAFGSVEPGDAATSTSQTEKRFVHVTGAAPKYRSSASGSRTLVRPRDSSPSESEWSDKSLEEIEKFDRDTIRFEKQLNQLDVLMLEIPKINWWLVFGKRMGRRPYVVGVVPPESSPVLAESRKRRRLDSHESAEERGL